MENITRHIVWVIQKTLDDNKCYWQENIGAASWVYKLLLSLAFFSSIQSRCYSPFGGGIDDPKLSGFEAHDNSQEDPGFSAHFSRKRKESEVLCLLQEEAKGGIPDLSSPSSIFFLFSSHHPRRYQDLPG
ncbi:hypothetical protein IEQ34_006957 [Dendrobium chrysotoxum]|uniref:Uncharacterized protein n=1 Tax=Dendrobium chrysotoxum TaxID=161865 RepID=A0AAV7H5K3_DENCH|nr:hypothetical protein IEQ34_006957 [Dendrobium chrysotoxum]